MNCQDCIHNYDATPRHSYTGCGLGFCDMIISHYYMEDELVVCEQKFTTDKPECFEA